METYKANGAEVMIEDDILTLVRKKIGKDEVRQIPLAAITDVRLKPGKGLTAGMLQLVLNNEPPADITVIEPNTLAFPRTSKDKATLAELHTRLLAVAEHNRATGSGPVAYDAPRRTLADRMHDNIEESKRKQAEREAESKRRQAERDAESKRRQAERDAQQAERDAQQAERDAQQAERAARQAEAERHQAELEEHETMEDIRRQLAEKGVTRPDVIAAARATMCWGAIASEFAPLGRMLRPEEPLVRATRAMFDEDRVGIAAITGSRLIVLDEGMFSDQVNEIPLTMIGTVTAEEEFFGNELTLGLRSGQTFKLRRVDDLMSFADTLRAAVRDADTPPPAPAAEQQDVLAQIAKLGDLHAAGVLTDAEFQAKKAELLDRL